MTPEEQRSAIVKACRWEVLSAGGQQMVTPDGGRTLYALDIIDRDLNVMHKVEMSLPDTLHSRYALTLEFVSGGRTNDPHNAGFSPFKCHTAKAHHRLEAALKTLDLWIEDA